MIENENEDNIPEPLEFRPTLEATHGITPEFVSEIITTAVTRHSMNSARTAQSLDNRLGASEIGVCRNYVRHVIIGTERVEDAKVPWAAAIGTALGEHIEQAVVAEFTIKAQRAVLTTMPSGLTIPGHVDLYQEAMLDAAGHYPGWVGDIKAKDGTRLIRDLSDVDRAHLFQIRLYHLALVQDGVIDRDAPAFIIYVDRSGKDPVPVVIEVPTGEEFIDEIDAWIEDITYAVKTGEEAQRDRSYSWCEVACPFFWTCRGADETHANGVLIEDEQQMTAIKAYREGKAMERAGKALAEEAKDSLVGVAGTTPDGLVLSWTSIGASRYEVERQPYARINVRALKK